MSVNNPDTTAHTEVRKRIDLGDSLKSLRANPQFQLLVNSYTVDELHKASAELISNPETRHISNEKIISIGHFNRFLADLSIDAENALDDLAYVGGN